MPEWSSRRRKSLWTPEKLRKQYESFRIEGWRASDPDSGANQDSNRSWRRAAGTSHTLFPAAIASWSGRSTSHVPGLPGVRAAAGTHAHGRILSLLGVGFGSPVIGLTRTQDYHGLVQIGYLLQTLKTFEQRWVKCACNLSTVEAEVGE